MDARPEGGGDVRKPGVLVIHNRYQQEGGEDAVVRAEVATLRQHGHRVTEFVRDNTEILSYGTARKASLVVSATWNQRVYRELRQLIRKERPAVAHCHNLVPLISPAAYYACRAEGVPVVQTLHNFRLRCPAGTMFRQGAACKDCHGALGKAVARGCYRDSRAQTAAAALMLGVHRAMKTFDGVVNAYSAPSVFCAERVANVDLPLEKITLRPNFLLDDPGARHGGENYAVFVGRLCEEKGVRQLLRTWRRLSGIPLVIVGDGPLRREAANQAPGNVTFAGALSASETLTRVKAARFLIFPSVGYETFGMTVLEAAACGVATVGTRLGAIPELIQEGRTGLLFDPHDSEEMADRVAWAWAHPMSMNEMGSAARRRYLEHYTADRGYEELVSFYGSVSAECRNEWLEKGAVA